MGPQQKIDDVAGYVDGAIQVFPLTLNVDINLIDASGLADGGVRDGETLPLASAEA
ncbi:hypothetical protein BN2476_1850003 [Paraburkholderia piptadeniae]|uniref:Uncharacterized protein n=1 Tax=Paraburkholderia piptadeniae TaxID=1701573 RepID=A0A1N7SYR0_9BURK|nr:hypothetical protein BN2476_1850003 [Paraburkholderia piptadeniae]